MPVVLAVAISKVLGQLLLLRVVSVAMCGIKSERRTVEVENIIIIWILLSFLNLCLALF